MNAFRAASYEVLDAENDDAEIIRENDDGIIVA